MDVSYKLKDLIIYLLKLWTIGFDGPVAVGLIDAPNLISATHPVFPELRTIAQVSNDNNLQSFINSL